MDILLPVCAGAVIACILASLLRSRTPELALLVVTAAGVLLLGQAVRLSGEVVDRLWNMAVAGGVEDVYIAPVLKCVGIGLLTELASQLCRDAGQASTASAVQLCGTLCALVVSLPLLEVFLEAVEGFL